jgi:hypothetical protein
MAQRRCFFFLVILVAFARPVGAQPFAPGCSLPFEGIKGTDPDGGLLPIDEKCGIEGDTKAAAVHQLQNKAKNNFCAPGVPVTVTMATFKKLQKAADDAELPHGGNNLPDDRNILADLVTATSHGKSSKVGEGTKVRFATFLLEAHYSNVSKGESVNCKKKGQQFNDIHVVLAENKDAEPCETVSAEVSPHFRPPAWLPDNLNRVVRPVRITGQMFFDASHDPCRDGKRASPARISVWEIHPIYSIDVCEKNSLASCDAENDSVWVPMHEWFALEEDHGDE